jgi:hypothetical protein
MHERDDDCGDNFGKLRARSKTDIMVSQPNREYVCLVRS